MSEQFLLQFIHYIRISFMRSVKLYHGIISIHCVMADIISIHYVMADIISITSHNIICYDFHHTASYYDVISVTLLHNVICITFSVMFSITLTLYNDNFHYVML